MYANIGREGNDLPNPPLYLFIFNVLQSTDVSSYYFYEIIFLGLSKCRKLAIIKVSCSTKRR